MIEVRNVLILSVILLFSGIVLGGVKPNPISLPKQTPLSNYHFDNSKVITVSLPNGNDVYNVFEVAMQAIEGVRYLKRLSANPSGVGLRPDLPSSDETDDDNQWSEYNQSALNWLVNNAVGIKDGYIWYYQFDNAYNDVSIKKPWGSAFGQAHVIKAFMYAYQITKNDTYKDYALKAAKIYTMSIYEGGFQSKLADGSVFFEEVPAPPAAHILNGHMISTVTLLELGREFKTDWVNDIAKAAVMTLEKHLKDYDLGYWSRYDLNPKKSELVFRLVPHEDSHSDNIMIDRVSLLNSETGEAVELDVGASDDAVGAWRVSGIEWGQIELIDDKDVRGLRYGPAKHCRPVKGGSLQNSYLIFQLPTTKFKDLINLPTFYLKIDYYDRNPGYITVEIQDVNHGNFMGFRTLSQGAIYLSGSDSWKTKYIPVYSKDLSWFMGPDYQVYHVKLLSELSRLTNKSLFYVYGARWKEYLTSHSEVNIESYLSIRKDCEKNNLEEK